MATLTSRVADLERWKRDHISGHVLSGHTHPHTHSENALVAHGHPDLAKWPHTHEVQPPPPPPVEPPPPEPTPPPPAARPFPAPVTTAVSAITASDDLQGRVNAAPDGTRFLFPAGTLFTLVTGIKLIGRHNLVFDLNGSTIRCTGSPDLIASSPFLLDGGNSDIAILNGTLEGNNQKTGTAIYGGGEDQQGVAIYGDKRIELDGLTIRKTFGDGVYMNEKDTTGSWPEDVWIHNVTLDRIGRQGFTVNSGRRVLIERADVDQVGMMVLDIEMDTDRQGVDGLVFRDVKAGVFGLNPVFTQWFVGCASQFAGLNAVVKNVTVEDNEVTGGIPASANTPASWSGLASWIGRPARMANWMFINNRTSKGGTQGVRFERIDGVTFHGNTQAGQPLAATYTECTNVRVNV